MAEVTFDRVSKVYPDGTRAVDGMSLDIADGQVQGIRSIVNPEKLGHVGPVADVQALLKNQPVSRRSSRRSPSG